MATLLDVDARTINGHLKNIFANNELQEDSVIQKFRITAADGKLANASMLHLNRQPRPHCHSGDSRSPESLIESRGGDER